MASADAGAAEEEAVAAVETKQRMDAFTALRVLTGLAGLYVLWGLRPWDFAGIGLERHAVWGTELVDAFPQSWLALRVGSWVFAAALVALAVGWRERVTPWVCLVLGLWLYGESQGITGTTHVHHLLVMFAVLGASRHRGWAMVFARVGLGCVYFFPGLAKLKVAADWPDMLRAHLVNHQAKGPTWIEVIPPRPVLVVLAFGALLFELFFGFLLFTRWRRHAVIAAVCFHLTTGMLMGIWFLGVVVLLPAFALAMPKPRGDVPHALIPAGVLVLGLLVTGFAGTNQAWPVASFPKFDYMPEGIDLQQAIATTSDGTRYRAGQVLLPHHEHGYWTKVEYGHPIDELEAAIADHLGQPVTITWENP